MDVKQVIVVRKDLKMRRGKEIAQGSHASIAFLRNYLANQNCIDHVLMTDEESFWLNYIQTKVCVRVNSEEELFAVHESAKENNLSSFLIQDLGKTEFDGVPTYTCCAIGPDLSEKIDEVTGNLALY